MYSHKSKLISKHLLKKNRNNGHRFVQQNEQERRETRLSQVEIFTKYHVTENVQNEDDC